MDKVSIVVPIYNVEKYIEKCLESLVNQTYFKLEILLVDDGSIDNSIAICEKYQEKDERIHILHQKNRGVSAARNLGTKEATGKWIVYVDPDDWLDGNIIEEVVNLAIKNQADIAQWNSIYEYEKSSKKRKPIKEKSFEKKEIEEVKFNILSPRYSGMTMGPVRGVWGKLYKREIIQKNGIEFPTDLRVFEDAMFNLEVLDHANRIIFCNIYGHHYRVTEQSAVNVFKKNYPETVERVLKKVITYTNDQDKKTYQELYYVLGCEFISTLFTRYFFHKNNQISNRLKEIDRYFSKKLYQEILKNVDKKYLNKKQKLLTTLLKNKMYRMIALLYFLKK